MKALALLLTGLFLLLSILPATRAQEGASGIMANGDLAVTGFSGTRELGGQQFIDPDGASLRIFDVSGRGKARGQVIGRAVKFEAFARDIGQVFGVALDNANPPNIYVTATSVHGLQIVIPDNNGDGIPERVQTGQPGATFMEGQFGTNLGGGPGSIYRIDGQTGEVTLFADIKLGGVPNSGPGLGNIAFDPAHFQFFVSDLDTGVIHRLDMAGNELGTYDHGVQGRPAAGLPAVPMDPGARMDITNPAFNAADPTTWGLAASERRVWGLAYFGGRLYYAVADGPQIWSVAIGADGAPTGDVRIEVETVPGGFPVSDMLFTPSGRMILAQRGGILGSFDYTQYHTPRFSRVLRYRRDKDGNWVQEPDEYAIGFPVDHKNASGGVGLACDATLWSTGDALRDNPELADRLTPGGEMVVHGLQGNKLSLVRPFNVPPWAAWFLDYDGAYGDPEKAGHVGDVEVYRNCAGGRAESFPGWFPIPDWAPPEGWEEPDWWPETPDLDLEKIAGKCVEDPVTAGAYLCQYTIVVTNMGGANFVGHLSVIDNPPPTGEFVPPPGGSIPWNCAQPGGVGKAIDCQSANVETLLPGESETLELTVRVTPADSTKPIRNCVILDDERHGADPTGPTRPEDPHGNNEDCDESELPRPDLELEKTFYECLYEGGQYRCYFVIAITNVGPVPYTGALHVVENIPPGTVFGGIWGATTPGWACVGGPPVECTLPDPPGVTMNPGDTELLGISIIVPLGKYGEMENCVSLGKPEHADDPEAPGANEACAPFEVVLYEPKCPAGWTEVPPGGAPPGYIVIAIDGINPDGSKWSLMCMAPKKTPPPVGPKCLPHEKTFTEKSQIPPFWTWRKVTKGGKTIYCATPLIKTPLSGPKCRPDETKFTKKSQIPQGWSWRKVTRFGKTIYCAKPPIVYPRPKCRPDETKFTKKSQIPQGWTWRKVTRFGKTIYCAKPPITPPKPPCVGGKLILLKTHPPRWRCVCPEDKRLVNGRCEPNIPSCPRERRKSNGTCCPVGYVADGNQCFAKPCPKGYARVAGKCMPITIPCPKGWKRVKGKCQPPVFNPPVTCPKSRRKSNGTCCPVGYVADGNQCFAKPCPKGWRKIGGRCKPPVIKLPKRCPKGWRKVGGKCRPPVLRNPPKLQPKPKPKACPKGWRRINGKCRPPVLRNPPKVKPKPRPKACPKGWRRINGKCRPIVLRPKPKACPKGWRRVRGKCIRPTPRINPNLRLRRNGQTTIVR